MKSILRTSSWIGLVTALATVAVLAPRIRTALAPPTASASTGIRPDPSEFRLVGDTTPALPESTAATRARRADVERSCPIVPRTLPASPRDALNALADDPQFAPPAAALGRPAGADRIADAELRRLLAADEPTATSACEVTFEPTLQVTLETRPGEPGPLVDAEEADAVSGFDARLDVPYLADTAPPEPPAPEPLTTDLEPRLVPQADFAPRSLAPADPQPVSPWPHPGQLIAGLEGLAEDPTTRPWAEAVAEEVALLQATAAFDDPVVAGSLERLAHLSESGKSLEKQLSSPAMRIVTLRARYALERRIAIWRPVATIAAAGPNGVPAAKLNAEALARAMAGVEEVLKQSKHHDGWRQFLNMEQILTALESDGSVHSEARRLARQALARMESTQLATSQRKFLGHPLFAPLNSQLHLWAAEPVHLAKLLRNIEQFEVDPSVILAGEIADQWNRMRWAPQAEVAELTRALNTYYRNANTRVAVSGKLLNRLLPIMQDMDEDVNEYMLGSRVVGRSRTSTELFVRLVPDPHRWRLALEARGDVNSQTQARVGWVRLFNRGESSYLARQLLQVGQGGIELDEPEAGADADTELTGVQSDVDGVPLLSAFVRQIARNQALNRRDEAAREVESRIAWRARRRLGEEVTSRVEQAEEVFSDKVLSPLQALELEPVTTQLMTTQERLISRARLAGYQQMGANTPRPRATSDSLLSVQIHQSAANNVIEQLDLDGKEYELHELYRELFTAFSDAEVEVPEDLPEGVTLRFAEKEAVSVRFEDGQAVLTIRMAEIKKGRKRWRDFEIRGFYQPDTSNRNADLVRDDFELIGEKLGYRDKIPLRLIFSKVLSKKRRLQLIHERLVNEPRLEDVQVSQFVIDNGWIGVALASRNGRPDLVARPAAVESDRR